ncbi:hypothetical protein CYMTET_29454, partial [Cymbomonas tetramitiformis]
DWMWFKLGMIREAPQAGLRHQATPDPFLLSELQGYMVKHKEHIRAFREQDPLLPVYMMLLSLQFKAAAQELSAQVDGVHIIIAMAHHGLLGENTQEPYTESPQFFNIRACIEAYAKTLEATDPKGALEYLAFAATGKDTPCSGQDFIPGSEEQLALFRYLFWPLILRPGY